MTQRAHQETANTKDLRQKSRCALAPNLLRKGTPLHVCVCKGSSLLDDLMVHREQWHGERGKMNVATFTHVSVHPCGAVYPQGQDDAQYLQPKAKIRHFGGRHGKCYVICLFVSRPGRVPVLWAYSKNSCCIQGTMQTGQ